MQYYFPKVYQTTPLKLKGPSLQYLLFGKMISQLSWIEQQSSKLWVVGSNPTEIAKCSTFVLDNSNGFLAFLTLDNVYCTCYYDYINDERGDSHDIAMDSVN